MADKSQFVDNMQVLYKLWPILAFGLGLFLAYVIIYKLVTSDYRREESPYVTAEMIFNVLMKWDGIMGESLREAIIILGPSGVAELADHLEKLPDGARCALIDVWDSEGYLRKYFDQAIKGTLEQRVAAIEILGKLSWAISIYPIMEALGDRNDEVRLAATEALSKIRSPEIIPMLIQALEDPYRYLPARIAEILMSYSDEAVPAMLAALPKLPVQSKVYLIQMLGGIEDKKIPSVLLEVLYDEVPEVRAASIEALAEQKYFDAAEGMSLLLKDKEWKVRSQAARALGVLGSMQSIPALQEVLKDEEWWVRTNAEAAIDEINRRIERG